MSVIKNIWRANYYRYLLSNANGELKKSKEDFEILYDENSRLNRDNRSLKLTNYQLGLENDNLKLTRGRLQQEINIIKGENDAN